jgi:hypothetical protein
MSINKKWIINSFNTDFSWVDDYTDNYIVYDKTCGLRETDKVKHQCNLGYNIYDYAYYIINNYENLPDVCVFIKANVFQHCKKEIFDTLITNNHFTPLEYYGSIPANNFEDRTPNGEYLEINNSWYIGAHTQTYGEGVNRYFKSFNNFLATMFETPEYPIWVRFSPGANYIVPKENITYYSLKFWKKILGYVSYHRIPSEAHIIERALYYIFSNKWRENANI